MIVIITDTSYLKIEQNRYFASELLTFLAQDFKKSLPESKYYPLLLY
jgi:hypothetical protein